MRRWLIVLAGFALIAAAVVYARGRPLDVHVDDIESVTIDPYPEGPPGPTFKRGARPSSTLYFPLEQIEPFLPDPLPNTEWQGLICRMGGNLIVTLRDGDVIAYGPCRRPASIDDLWARMLEVYRAGE